MNLFPGVAEAYTKDNLPMLESQRLAHFIAYGPMIFEAARLLVKFGLLDRINHSPEGLKVEEAAEKCGISEYAARVLLEAGLSMGAVIVNPETDRYSITKTGWFLQNSDIVRINLDFNHDVNYEGMFRLEESLLEGKPVGLKHFGSWPTIYEGLSSLPEQVQKSWFAFDHHYSDISFRDALKVVFSLKPARIMDVGGNTGRFALRCVAQDPDVKVTIVDLPQQIGLMKANIKGQEGADRIDGYGANMLDPESKLPEGADVIWMSQFLDCFSEQEIVAILKKAASVMSDKTRLCIMETFWDRQRFETASLNLTMTSLYFTALANGNSRMYHSDVMIRLVGEAGLEVETIHDALGEGHSILVCKK